MVLEQHRNMGKFHSHTGSKKTIEIDAFRKLPHIFGLEIFLKETFSKSGTRFNLQKTLGSLRQIADSFTAKEPIGLT